MSTFTFGSVTVSIDPAYRALGGAMRGMAKNVFSFQVKKLEEGSWYLITNRQNFIGRYPSQAACISVLYGIMTFNDGLDSGFEVWANSSLDSGASEIDPDINVFTLDVSGSPTDSLVGTLASISYSGLGFTGEPYFGYQNSIDNELTWGVNGVASDFILGDRITAIDGATQADTPSTTAYSTFAENSAMRCVLLDGTVSAYTDPAYLITFASGGLFIGDTLTVGSLLYDTLGFQQISSNDGSTLTLTFSTNAAATNWVNGGGQYIGASETYDASEFTVSTTTASRVNSAAECTAMPSGSTISLTLSQTEYSVSSFVSNILWKDDVDNTDISLLAVDISGASTVGTPVELNGYSYAIPDESLVTLDPGEDITYTYAWYREIPTLTSITSS